MDERSTPFPDPSRLSILISTILLAYALTGFVSIPTLEMDFTVLGIYFPIRINFLSLVTLLVAGLTASGTAWLLQDHPAREDVATTVVHWLLPALTALVLLQAINQLPLRGLWWIAALGSGFLLTLVLQAEFIAMDPGNRFFVPAEMGITALSMVLFFILAIFTHSSGSRLFYRVPVLSLAALLVYLRIIHLGQNGDRALVPGSVSFLLIGELAAGLHYLPLDPIGFGIALTGPLYALVEISELLLIGEESPPIHSFIWPILIILLSWGTALLI